VLCRNTPEDFECSSAPAARFSVDFGRSFYPMDHAESDFRVPVTKIRAVHQTTAIKTRPVILSRPSNLPLVFFGIIKQKPILIEH
jgi:hypothetical protein